MYSFESGDSALENGGGGLIQCARFRGWISVCGISGGLDFSAPVVSKFLSPLINNDQSLTTGLTNSLAMQIENNANLPLLLSAFKDNL